MELIGKQFLPIVGNQILMLVNGQLKTISTSFAQVVAMPCQSIDEYEVKPLTCSNTVIDLNGDLGYYYVACPKNCNKSKFPLFGDILFSQDSSICKAVKYSGN